MTLKNFLLAAVLAASPAAFANALDDFLAFNAQAKTATAHFEQQVFDQRGKVVDRSSGTFAFARPGKFRWVYEKPVKQALVGDGAKLWIHDADLNQVTVKRIDKAMSATPAALLAGKDDITKVFLLTDAGEKDGLGWVVATPKEKDTGFESVRIGMKGKTLAAMELSDSLGGRTSLVFSDLKPNAALPPNTFTFTPPKGADVMDETK
ncbi:outer membrane lipoprotein carrier protein LolA [Betaproteobacteria bacterium GR16-43]|nr:outer membrane lipoprotein carrier protein LolA [Betaproteobacteria bacterium GR16-43]